MLRFYFHIFYSLPCFTHVWVENCTFCDESRWGRGRSQRTGSIKHPARCSLHEGKHDLGSLGVGRAIKSDIFLQGIRVEDAAEKKG